jgi:negative regulator of replication initiation
LVGREVTTVQSKGRTRKACADTEQTLVLVGGQIRSKGQTDTITRCR